MQEKEPFLQFFFEISKFYCKLCLEGAGHTKGSVHTMEEDIDKLTGIAEGKAIVIDGFEYKVIGGKFVKTKKI